MKHFAREIKLVNTSQGTFELLGYEWMSRKGIQKVKPPVEEELMGVIIRLPDGTEGMVTSWEVNFPDLENLCPTVKVRSRTTPTEAEFELRGYILMDGTQSLVRPALEDYDGVLMMCPAVIGVSKDSALFTETVGVFYINSEFLEILTELKDMPESLESLES